MLFSVVQTHRKGVRLSREDIETAAPTLGLLTIVDWKEGHSSRRAVRIARLHHPKISYCPELLVPLFDPTIVRMNARGFLLVGFECEGQAAGMVADHVQGWWVREAQAAPENLLPDLLPK